jgi:hypothetical protein
MSKKSLQYCLKFRSFPDLGCIKAANLPYFNWYQPKEKNMKMLVLATALSLISSISSAHVCAVLKEHQAPSQGSDSLVLHDGETIRSLEEYSRYYGRSWNNSVSRVVVKPGCTLVAYQYDNFNRHWSDFSRLNGYKLVVSNAGGHYSRESRRENLHGIYNDTISSVRCSCQ